MWKKEEAPSAPPAAGTPQRVEPSRAQPQSTGHATIGRSIVIRGEVSGDEDLLIQGVIDGAVTLGQHSVTVGDGGRVKANVTGRVITVEGEVEGDLQAQEQIILRGSARVQGDIKAPRVVLEDGASFRGLVDMGAQRGKEGPAAAKAGSRPGAAEAPKEQPAKAETGAGRAPEGAGVGGSGKSRGPSAPTP